jgi:hypothetical protein
MTRRLAAASLFAPDFGCAEGRVGAIRASLMSARSVNTPKSNPKDAVPTS